jgi:galactokinase
MVRLAQNIPGCLGARLTGAGFGGCTINIVEEELASDFVSILAESYHTATGINPDIYLCHAAKGASLD